MTSLTRVAVLFLFCVAVGRSEDVRLPSSPSWRCEANGGINVLYCYLRVNGAPCKYTDLLKIQAEEVGNRTHTALSLTHIAARLGFPLRPVSLTLDEVFRCPLPVIVHMDGESPDAGSFLLVFAVSPHEVSFINGPTAVVRDMSREDFGRIWSGVALQPSTARWQNAAFYGLGFSLGLLPMLIIRFIKRR